VVMLVVILLVLVGVGALWFIQADADSVIRTIPFATGAADGPVALSVDTRDGRAVVAGSGTVTMVDSGSGDIRNALALGRRFVGPLAVATGAGRVFVASLQGGAPPTMAAGMVSVFDVATGTRIRTIAVGVGLAGVAVDERTNRAFVTYTGIAKPDGTPTGPGSVSVLNARSGALLTTVRVGLQHGAIGVDGSTGHVFVLNQRSNSMTMLDARSGKPIRTVCVGPFPFALAVDEHTHRVFVVNPGAGAGGGTVSVLDARTGMVVRTVPVGPGDDAIAVDAVAGRVIVTSGGATSRVTFLDATTGVVRQTTSVGGSPFAVAVDTRTNRTFVTGTDGGLFALVHHVAPGEPPDWAGYVGVLDTRSGALLRTIRVGRDPRGIAVDERAGHAFVINGADNSISVLDAAR